jgi:SAM-dependent methyltransferase
MTSASAHDSGPFYWDRFRDTTVGRYLFQRERAFIDRALGHEGRRRAILDVGCGSGRFTIPLSDAGHQLVGTDLSRVALAAFRQRSLRVPLVLGDASYLPFVDGSFDGVIAVQTLDYVPLGDFMRECGRVLRPGGLLIFDSLNRRGYKWRLKNLLGRQLMLPSADLDYQDVLRAALDHGFEIQAIRGYNWAPVTRESNSKLVHLAALVESALGLDRYYQLSPKILVAARKGRR